MFNVASLIVGDSFRLLRLIVIVAVSVNPGIPESVVSTVKINVGLVSKSNTLLSFTVMTPVVLSMLNVLFVLPPVMA